MKRTNLLIALVLLGVSVSFWKCGDDPPPAVSPQDAQLAKLSKTWKANATTYNSGAITGYENFVITMTGTPGTATFNYTITGRPTGPTPWPASGTFTFGTDFATILTREDGIVVTYSVTDTQLQFNFTYAGSGFTGRVGNVEGVWSYTFGL